MALPLQCNLASGSTGCYQYSVGGLNRILLANKNDIQGYTIDSTTGAFTDVTLKAGKTFYEFQFPENTGIANSELQNNGAGIKNHLHTVGFTLTRYDQAISNILNELGLAKVVAIVQTKQLNDAAAPTNRENRVLIFGAYNGLDAQSIVSTLGPALATDASRVITLQGIELYQPDEITPDPLVYTSNSPIEEFLDAMLVY